MTATNKSKWYDSKPLLIILLFILPPLGIVGICKRNSFAWKKIVYILGGITGRIVYESKKRDRVWSLSELMYRYIESAFV